MFLFFAFLFVLPASLMAMPVELDSFSCENSTDRFDSRLQIEYNFFYQGRASCRSDRNIYFYNLSTPLSVTNSTFRIVFYKENNGSLPINGRLSSGLLASFTRVSSQRVTGEDGRNWRELVYEYNGGSTVDTLERIEWDFNGTVRFDEISFYIDSPFLGQRYFQFQSGHSDIDYNFGVEDFLNETLLTKTYKMEGRLESFDSASNYALDTGVNSFAYINCESVSITNIELALVDQLGASYEVECLDSSLVDEQRGLFKITNTGTTPQYSVKFDISINATGKFTEDATSTNFSFPLLINTRITP